jgi:adenylosuccinate synthase
MPGIALVGTQWGDEGKGKVTDLLAGTVDFVVRYQGGNNAGHTIVVEGERYALHLVPTGVLYEDCIPVIGPGVVVNPQVLLEEIDTLEARGIDTSRLLLSGNAHRTSDREMARQEPSRHNETGHRPCVRGQSDARRFTGSGSSRSQDLFCQTRSGPQREESVVNARVWTSSSRS